MTRFIYVILVLTLSTSCVTLPKAIDRVTRDDASARAAQAALNSKYMPIVAGNCSNLFPIKESEVKETKIVPGNTQEFKAEVRQAMRQAERLQKELARLPVKHECKAEIVERDKVIEALRATITSLHEQSDTLRADVERVTIEKTQENRAALAEAQFRIDSLQTLLNRERHLHELTKAERDSLNEKLKKFWIGIAISGFLAIIAVVLWVYSKFFLG